MSNSTLLICRSRLSAVSTAPPRYIDKAPGCISNQFIMPNTLSYRQANFISPIASVAEASPQVDTKTTFAIVMKLLSYGFSPPHAFYFRIIRTARNSIAHNQSRRPNIQSQSVQDIQPLRKLGVPLRTRKDVKG